MAVAGLLFLGSLGWFFRPAHAPSPSAPDAVQTPIPSDPLPVSAGEPTQGMDPIVARWLALAEMSPREQSAAMQDLLPDLTVGKLLEVLQLLAQRNEGDALQIALLGRLAALDETSAMAWLDQWHYGPETLQTMAVVNGLTKPQMALPWLEAMPESESRNELLGLTLGRWAELSAVEAMNYALRETSPGLRADFLAKVISFSARSNPAQGFEWARQYQAQYQDPDLLKLTALGWASSDDAAASDHILNLPADEPGRDAAVSGLIEYNLSRDLPRAFELIAQVKEGRRTYYCQAAREWMEQDPGAASEWIATTTELTDADRQELLPMSVVAQ